MLKASLCMIEINAFAIKQRRCLQHDKEKLFAQKNPLFTKIKGFLHKISSIKISNQIFSKL